MNSLHKVSLISVALAAVTLGSNAFGKGPVLEEVIVAAEKREESIKDFPISIAAFTNDMLEKWGVSGVKGLASKVPNLVINEFAASSTTVRLFIRGVGKNDVQVTQDPSVALYMDGIYVGSSVETAFERADIERIEVRRGPRGTLYGRNATGGALNTLTRRVDPSNVTFRQKLTGGNLGRIRSHSVVSSLITDSTALKVAYSYAERDCFVENLGSGKDFGEEKRENITVDFHLDVSDEATSFDNILTGDDTIDAHARA